MAGSTFNLRGCSTTGGSAGGGGACGITVRVAPEDITSTETSAQLIATRANELLKESVASAINDHLAVNGVNSKRIAFPATLTYNCPKVGDAVRWDATNSRYDLAYATFDVNASDMDHLTEAIGLVESVETTCEGGTPSASTNAMIVMFGEIEFKNLDLVNNPLTPGSTYYLYDRGEVNKEDFANNLVLKEPSISKPMLFARTESTGFVTHYRPMTGSASGGVTEREDYNVALELIPGGWRVTVTNIGDLASRHPLAIKINYNQLVGGTTVPWYRSVGVLRSLAQATAPGQQNLGSNQITFDVTKDSALYGTSSSRGSAAVNGVGSLYVEVISDTSENMLESVIDQTIPRATSAVVNSIPKLEIQGRCAEEQQPNIKNNIAGGDENLVLTEGAMFDISGINGVGGRVDDADVNFTIEMPISLAVEMSWSSDADPSVLETASTTFKLPDQDGTSVEVFPVNDAGSGITEKKVTLKVNGVTGVLPDGHWAQYLVQQEYPIMCSDEMCCSPSTKARINSNSGNSVSITDLLAGVDNTLINNASGAKLYTMADGSNIVWPTGQKPTDGLEVSWKNVREDIQLCYPAGVKSGTEPAFMTIYANEARPNAVGQIMDQHEYDPRYILAEIGAQDSLNGHPIKLTLNHATPRTECCFSVEFNGTLEGTHYTIQELCDAGLMKQSTIGCPQSCG